MSYVWSFRQFKALSGRKAINDWRKGLSPARQATLDKFLDRVAKMQTWATGICDPIKNHAGCWELRWTSEKVEHRIFGYYRGEKEFVMLVGCTHKGRVYDPPGAFQVLDERKRKIENGEAELDEYRVWSDSSYEEQGLSPRSGERPN
jgi:hypothetical protein